MLKFNFLEDNIWRTYHDGRIMETVLSQKRKNIEKDSFPQYIKITNNSEDNGKYRINVDKYVPKTEPKYFLCDDKKRLVGLPTMYNNYDYHPITEIHDACFHDNVVYMICNDNIIRVLKIYTENNNSKRYAARLNGYQMHDMFTENSIKSNEGIDYFYDRFAFYPPRFVESKLIEFANVEYKYINLVKYERKNGIFTLEFILSDGKRIDLFKFQNSVPLVSTSHLFKNKGKWKGYQTKFRVIEASLLYESSGKITHL